MKICILSGGTGSSAIQLALKDFREDISVIINMFDNGLSTGQTRRIYGDIPGPSDLRKVQTFASEFIFDSPTAELAQRLNWRLTGTTRVLLEEADNLLSDITPDLSQDFIRKTARRMPDSVKDFCVGNLVYGYLLKTFGVKYTTRTMAKALRIPLDYCLSITNENRDILGVTLEGKLIPEEDMVNNTKYVFKEVVFDPAMIPFISQDAFKVLSKADAVILSSGTFWSSLAPTYKIILDGLLENKRVIGVSNLVVDRDMILVDNYKEHTKLMTEHMLGVTPVWLDDLPHVEGNATKHEIEPLRYELLTKLGL